MACGYADINWLPKGKTKKLKSLNVENDLVKYRTKFWIHVRVKLWFFLIKKKLKQEKFNLRRSIRWHICDCTFHAILI